MDFALDILYHVPEARAFKVWLGDDKNAVLTEEEWKGLWLEFQELIPNSIN